MRRMVTLGIEGGRERQHVRGTELHAKATGFAALNDDRNTSFCHESTPARNNHHSDFNCGGCDYAWEEWRDGVMAVTLRREAKHERRKGSLSCKLLIMS